VRALTASAAAALFLISGAGCKKKVSRAQCDELLDRYAGLVAKEKLPEATPAAQRAEQDRERTEALGVEAFKRCPTEVTEEVYACTQRAKTSDDILHCLE